MVYYHTSANMKMLRNIIIDFGATQEVSPCEYMKTYVEKCPEDTEDAKISWIVDTFLSMQRYGDFLRNVASHLSNELTEEDQDYFMISLHAVTFLLQPKEMSLLYKCLFNLSKPLLDTFTKFLSNNEVLPFISLVAQKNYDTHFITENIISPLFSWQPYISEMAHTYAEYVKTIESRKIKPPTVPVQLNVLNRKGKGFLNKEFPPSASKALLPDTPPNSIKNKPIKMLSKFTIDQRLKQIHAKNKQKAAVLLQKVKSNESHYAQKKSEKNVKAKTETEFNEGKSYTKPKPKIVVRNSPQPVKENAATLKRLNMRMQINQQQEVEWLENILGFKNTFKIYDILEHTRQENERERLVDIEKKHLLGQISHEEAVIAKKRYLEENKRKYEEFLKEKEQWNNEIEEWKAIESEKSRKQVERLSLDELSLAEAKNSSFLKKKQYVDKLKQESQILLEGALKQRKEELDRKVEMIKEIKILSLIARKARIPKILDLTETSNLGLMCEMSLAELQERLSAVKVGFREELERKKNQIKEDNILAKKKLENVKETFESYIKEKSEIRKCNKDKKAASNVSSISNLEIDNLKKVLEEKRQLRMRLAS